MARSEIGVTAWVNKFASVFELCRGGQLLRLCESLRVLEIPDSLLEPNVIEQARCPLRKLAAGMRGVAISEVCLKFPHLQALQINLQDDPAVTEINIHPLKQMSLVKLSISRRHLPTLSSTGQLLQNLFDRTIVDTPLSRSLELFEGVRVRWDEETLKRMTWSCKRLTEVRGEGLELAAIPLFVSSPTWSNPFSKPLPKLVALTRRIKGKGRRWLPIFRSQRLISGRQPTWSLEPQNGL